MTEARRGGHVFCSPLLCRLPVCFGCLTHPMSVCLPGPAILVAFVRVVLVVISPHHLVCTPCARRAAHSAHSFPHSTGNVSGSSVLGSSWNAAAIVRPEPPRPINPAFDPTNPAPSPTPPRENVRLSSFRT
ncbi:hypothetical protein LZ30DRAFT_702471 [Colletotrichum cereale]|nr:hypothetical protein LZ30DRAFT_702471 [Colletotrichum cereale]